jgi:DNA repair exonuclease SbcCD ATPase subunit
MPPPTIETDGIFSKKMGTGDSRIAASLVAAHGKRDPPLSVALTLPATFSPRPLAETTAAIREECGNFHHLAGELYADIERLGDELLHKADEIEIVRKQLDERERELAEERQQTSELGELLETQQALVEQAISELQSLRRQSTEELGELRRQLGATQAQLGDARTQLHDAIARAAEAASQAAIAKSGPAVADETRARLAKLEHERRDLEEENKLLRARATALQETVNEQRRDLNEQQAEISTELKQLRDLLAERGHDFPHVDHDVAVTVAAATAHDESEHQRDPVVSSVMAQFARLQKDVAQRRKKK